MSRLDEIPTAFDAPADARPSAVVARIRAIRPSRRTVLRGLLISAAAAALVPIDWYLTRREAVAAEPRTDGDDKSEHMTCAPASYREEANNWPATGPAVCYGGFRRGGFPCSDGYHREGSYKDGPDAFESTRVTQSCNGRNAWRWNGYRCSDAITNVVFADGTEYRGISIAACPAPGGEMTAPESEPETTSPSPSNDREESGSGESGSGESGSGESGSGDSGSGESGSEESGSGGSGGDAPGRGGSDPSRPRRLLPAFGTNLRSIPVLGSLVGT
jgi:hypothetical protein